MNYPKAMWMRLPLERLNEVLLSLTTRHQTFKGPTIDKTRAKALVYVKHKKQLHKIELTWNFNKIVGTPRCPMMIWDINVEGPEHILEFLIGTRGPWQGIWASLYEKEA